MVDRRRRVIWTDAALWALDAAAAYIAVDSPDAASRLVDRILSAANSLQTLSNRGRNVREVTDSATRELLIPPFRLIYRVQEAEVLIVTLLHEARDFDRWRSDPL